MSDTENKPPHADAAGNEPAIGDKEDVKVRRDSFSSSSGSTISTVSSNVGDNATRANGSRIPTPSKIPMRRGSSVGTNSGASAAAAAASVASAAQSTPLSTPTKRRPTDSGPTVAPNRLGMAARVTPRVLEKKVVRAGSPNDTLGQRPGLGDSSSGSTRAQSSLELRKAYSASLRNRGMASSSSASARSRKPLRSLSELQSRHQSLKDLADMEDDRRSSIGSVSSCSSISSAATSASVVSSTPSRSTQRSISSTPGRKTSGIASNSRPSPGRPKSMRKLWPTTVVKEEFTLEEATVQALKEQHFLAEQAIRDLLSEIQQGSSTSTARLEDVSVLRQGLRQLTAHSEVLMQCIEAFEQKTLDQEEYVEASHAEIDRLMGLLTEENALATQMHMPDMEEDIEAMPDALVIRTPDTGESSSSLELDITPAESSDDTEQHREEMLNAMKEDSPLSAYVREILKNATDKIEEKWKARFAEQLAEHEQALAQERERTSASVVTNSRMATETMQSKDDEIKALREENSAILAQKKHIEIELDFAKQELEFMKQQLDEQDDERSSNAHSFWQKTTDLAKKNRTLTEELAVANQTVNRLNETIKIMKSKATDAKADNLDRIRKTREMESEKNLLYDNLASMEAKFEDEKARREQFQVNVEQLTVENTALYAQMVALQTTHEAKMEELRQLYEKRNGVLAGEMKLLQTQNRLMRSAEPTGESSRGNSGASRFSREEEGEMSDRLKEMTDELLDTRQELSEKIEIISELERRVADGEILRRKLHNTIQELRGNVRVHVRLRPFLRSDGEENVHGEPPQPSLRCDTFGSTISTNVEKPHTFAFDKIYGQSDSQETVFDDVAEFVQSAMDGYNVCIFAYGQTGSGKTHTMQGSGKAQMRGIIPRSIEHIINTCEQLSSMGWTYALDVNFFGIYNETIRDLLATDNRREQRKYNIRTDKRGKNYVEGLTEIAIDFENAHEQIEDIVNLAACNRSVDRTDMNAHSSRSHSIFTMKIRGFNEAQNTEMEGSLSLVDLAGSERLSRSNATGDRLKEAQAINKSLSSLADVFQALVKKSNHVPYRNSKLTYVLQPALSGDGKTLMMVNLSPTFMSLDESLCSLRFAQNVSQCELGAPVRQIKARSSFYGKEALAANSGPQSSPAKTGAPPRRSSLTPSTFSSLSARKFP